MPGCDNILKSVMNEIIINEYDRISYQAIVMHPETDSGNGYHFQRKASDL
jgi:hypothetical protein